MEQSIADKVKSLKEAKKRWSDRATKRGSAAMFYGGAGAISTLGTAVAMNSISQSFSRHPEDPVYAFYGLALVGAYVGIAVGGATLINGVREAIRAASAQHQADFLDDQIAVIEQSPGYKTDAQKQARSA